jgi:hypothetical protein
MDSIVVVPNFLVVNSALIMVDVALIIIIVLAKVYHTLRKLPPRTEMEMC